MGTCGEADARIWNLESDRQSAAGNAVDGVVDPHLRGCAVRLALSQRVVRIARDRCAGHIRNETSRESGSSGFGSGRYAATEAETAPNRRCDNNRNGRDDGRSADAGVVRPRGSSGPVRWRCWQPAPARRPSVRATAAVRSAAVLPAWRPEPPVWLRLPHGLEGLDR
jgi:hypothetical protein